MVTKVTPKAHRNKNIIFIYDSNFAEKNPALKFMGQFSNPKEIVLSPFIPLFHSPVVLNYPIDSNKQNCAGKACDKWGCRGKWSNHDTQFTTKNQKNIQHGMGGQLHFEKIVLTLAP